METSAVTNDNSRALMVKLGRQPCLTSQSNRKRSSPLHTKGGACAERGSVMVLSCGKSDLKGRCLLLLMRTQTEHHARHGSSTTWVDSDEINYATKYTNVK